MISPRHSLSLSLSRIHAGQAFLILPQLKICATGGVGWTLTLSPGKNQGGVCGVSL